jgi:DNA recombination protein RmuC
MNIFLIIFGSILTILGVVQIIIGIKQQNNKNNGKIEQEIVELQQKFLLFEQNINKIDPLIRQEFLQNREENQKSFKENREESLKTLKENREETQKALKENREELSATLRLMGDKLVETQEKIKKETEDKLKDIRETVENKLTTLQEENGKKLDEMRKTVDEKLQESVEKRFNESFKLINERLEAVSQGLGEMQNLATGVGDLKKVLTNVKTRGTYGEVQLGLILEQVLSPEQYIKNDHPDDENGRNVVEYSVKLPGNNDSNEPVFLPIDSKFPIEDYQRLMDAYDNNSDAIEFCGKQFEAAVKKAAKDIHDKYIKPPKTTDFAVLFVPTEGLYAEILRRPGFFEVLQNDFRVTVVGPTNLVAFLSSLQMGFRTLTIQKRSSEVWQILGAVKTEFKMFGDVLDKTQKKLQEASNVIDTAGRRSRAIERKLKNVHEVPKAEAITLIGEAEEILEEEELF